MPTLNNSFIALWCGIFLGISAIASAQEYRPAPIDNPLKGLVPYQGAAGDRFPHSLEFGYLKFSDLVTERDRYDWEPLERLLEDVRSRGNQTVFRVYLEYPGKSGVVPDFLVGSGVNLVRWQDPSLGQDWVETPDYAHPALRSALHAFILELGKRYDGDPRIGYVTAGLLGLWGEWHTYPRTDLWASKEVQAEVMDAFEQAFHKTPVLLRYPVGAGRSDLAGNSRRGFGYHDDSFAFATLHTGVKGEEWFFESLLRQAKATEKWKRFPIGGEIRPEVWGCCFDAAPCSPRQQEFGRCRDATHVTWLMDSGMFAASNQSPERVANAKKAVRRMGYEFFVESMACKRDGVATRVNLKIKNTGIAPLYHAGWPIHLKAAGEASVNTGWELNRLLPGQSRSFEGRFKLARQEIAIGIPNPMAGGKPIRFANVGGEEDAWLDSSVFQESQPEEEER